MGERRESFMVCTETYKEHIEYTFNTFCKVVIRYAAINVWRDRDKRRQKEISFEYLTEEKFYPFSTTDKYFIDPCKQYPVTICGQRVILTNGGLSLPCSSSALMNSHTPKLNNCRHIGRHTKTGNHKKFSCFLCLFSAFS